MGLYRPLTNDVCKIVHEKHTGMGFTYVDVFQVEVWAYGRCLHTPHLDDHDR